MQIMHVLYANNPGQRILLITHSNQALNDLFGKLMQVCLLPCPCRLLLLLPVPPALCSPPAFSIARAERTLRECLLYQTLTSVPDAALVAPPLAIV